MAYNHAPEGYKCPVCIGISGGTEGTFIVPTDVIYEDDLVVSIINTFFMPGNEGHAIVVPKQHYENLFDLPQKYSARIIEVASHIAQAMKSAYSCDGITLRQNNEPAGDQHAFHFHMHVYPRYDGDTFNANQLGKLTPTPEERQVYAAKLTHALSLLNLPATL